MFKFGTDNIGKVFLGSTEISKAYLGEDLVYNGGSTPPPQPPIPAEYTELDYFTTSNVQKCFKTDFVPTTDCKVEVCFQGTSTTSTKAGCMFGSRTGYNSNSFYFKTAASSGSATNITAYMGFKTERTQSVSVNASDKHVYGIDAGRFYVDEETLATYTDTFTPTYPIFIMRWNNAGTAQQNAPIGYLFYCKCWDGNGELVRHYVPVERISDSQQGIYDIITQTFLILE